MAFNYELFETNCESAGGEFHMNESNRGTKTASCDFDQEPSGDLDKHFNTGDRRSLIVQDRADKDYVTAKVVVTGRGTGQITNPRGSHVDYPTESDFRGAEEVGVPARKTLVIKGEKGEKVQVSGEPASRDQGEKTRRRRVD